MAPRTAALSVLGVAIAAGAIGFADGYQLYILALVGLTTIVGVGLNILLGLTGQISLGHVGFYAIGAYAVAILTANHGWNFWPALAVAMIVSGIAGGALALPALRVRGEYFVAASLGLQMLALTVFSEWKSVTGGIGGLIGIPPARLFGFDVSDPVAFLILTLACLAIILLVIRALVRSSFGRSLKAIRDDETAASALGKNVAFLKTLAVMVSSAFAAEARSPAAKARPRKAVMVFITVIPLFVAACGSRSVQKRPHYRP